MNHKKISESPVNLKIGVITLVAHNWPDNPGLIQKVIGLCYAPTFLTVSTWFFHQSDIHHGSNIQRSVLSGDNFSGFENSSSHQWIIFGPVLLGRVSERERAYSFASNRNRKKNYTQTLVTKHSARRERNSWNSKQKNKRLYEELMIEWEIMPNQGKWSKMKLK